MNRRGFFGALLALPMVVRAELRRRRMADYINAQLGEIAAPYVKPWGMMQGATFMRDSDPPVQWDEPFYQTIILKPGEVVG